MDVPQLDDLVGRDVLEVGYSSDELSDLIRLDDIRVADSVTGVVPIDLKAQLMNEAGNPITDDKGNALILGELIIACLSAADPSCEDRAERFLLIRRMVNNNLVLYQRNPTEPDPPYFHLIVKWVNKTIHNPYLWGRITEQLGFGF